MAGRRTASTPITFRRGPVTITRTPCAIAGCGRRSRSTATAILHCGGLLSSDTRGEVPGAKLWGRCARLRWLWEAPGIPYFTLLAHGLWRITAAEVPQHVERSWFSYILGVMLGTLI